MHDLKLVPAYQVEHRPFPEDVRTAALAILRGCTELHNRLNELDRSEYPALGWAQIALSDMAGLACSIHNATTDYDEVKSRCKSMRARADELKQVRGDLFVAGQ